MSVFECRINMPSCCVPGCKSRFLNNNSNDIQFFRFPSKRPEQCAQWSRAIGRSNWQFTKWSKICSLHFAAKDYSPRFPGVIRYLKRDAIPSEMLPTGSPSDYESDDCENSSMTNDRFFETATQPNVEATQSVISNPTPIALIRVSAAHEMSDPLSDQRQTEPIRRESNADVDGKRHEALILSHGISEAFSILPDEESDASTNEKRPEPNSILPDDESDEVTFIKEKRPEPVTILLHDESDELVNEKRPEPVVISSHEESNVSINQRTSEPVRNSSHDVSNPYVKLTRNVDVFEPRELSEVVANGNKTRAACLSLHGIGTPGGKEKTTETINMSAGKEKATKSINGIKYKAFNAVDEDDATEPSVIHLLSAASSNVAANKRATGIIHRFPRPNSFGNNGKKIRLLQPVKNNLRTIKPKTKSRSEYDKAAVIVDEVAKDLNLKLGHHTIRIIPVEASDPILAIHCPLSCQETYMALPFQSLASKKSCSIESEVDQTAQDKSLNVNTGNVQTSTQKENVNELSEIEALKKEIAKLNRTIGRQRKRLQYPVQMRELRKRQRRN